MAETAEKTETDSTTGEAPVVLSAIETVPPSLASASVTHQVAATVAELQKTREALPLDLDLDVPRQRDANFVRRSLLTQQESRLQMAFLALVEWERPMATDLWWVELLRLAHRDLSAQLLAIPAGRHGDQRRADQLRGALRDLQRAPQLFNGKEFSVPVLVDWLLDHGVRPGASGVFDGRPGLVRGEALLKAKTEAVAAALADVERELQSAQALLTS